MRVEKAEGNLVACEIAAATPKLQPERAQRCSGSVRGLRRCARRTGDQEETLDAIRAKLEAQERAANSGRFKAGTTVAANRAETLAPTQSAQHPSVV